MAKIFYTTCCPLEDGRKNKIIYVIADDREYGLASFGKNGDEKYFPIHVDEDFKSWFKEDAKSLDVLPSKALNSLIQALEDNYITEIPSEIIHAVVPKK